MALRRLEARLVAPGPASTWQRRVRKVAKALEATANGQDGYVELAVPALEGRPQATAWAVWWEEAGQVVLDLCLEDHLHGGDEATRAAARAGLLQIFEWLRDGTHAKATDVVIKAASKPPLRPRVTGARGAAPDAPASKPIAFERLSQWRAKDAGFQAKCPQCGGFSNYPEPGRVMCRFCSQWFTLNG